MLDRLFGPHRSVQRQITIGLTFLVVVLGVVVLFVESILMGILVILVGILAGAMLARMAENRVARAASTELLGSVSGDVDEAQLQRMVDQARSGSPARMPQVGPRRPGPPASRAGEVGSLPWTDGKAG